MRQLSHDIERYDEHLCLKIPLMLWLTLVFLSRHLLLLGITFLPTTGEEIKVLRELIQPQYLIADLMALPVVIAAIRRRPQAPRWMRRVWRHGRGLLLLATLSDLLMLILSIGLSLGPGHLVQALSQRLNEATLASLIISSSVLLYLATGQLVRDVFRDWPALDVDPGR